MTKVNEQIKAGSVRVIDEDGSNNIMNTREALQKAKGMSKDLIEVDGRASPPVCKIMELGKFKYLQKKQEVKAPRIETKEIRIRPNTDVHDLETRKRQMKTFLEEGHRVKLVMVFSGREMNYRSQGQQKMMELIKDLPGKIDGKVHNEGNKIFMNLVPA